MVPAGMRVAGAWSWRVAVVLIVSAMLIWLLSKVMILLIPIMVATILASLLRPLVKKLKQIGVPQGLSVAIAEVGLVVVVVGALFLVGRQMIAGFSDLSQQAVIGLIKIQDWLTDGPLGLSNDQMTKYLDEALAALQNNTNAILSGALGVGSGLTHFTIGLLLTLFILLFFLLEGQDIWAFIVKFFHAVPGRPLMVQGAVGGCHWAATPVCRYSLPPLTPSASVPVQPSSRYRWHCRWVSWFSWAHSFP